LPTITITTPTSGSAMPSDIVGTYTAGPTGTPIITCFIHRTDNGKLVQTPAGQLDVPSSGQWTAPVNLGALPATNYFIVAVITQDGSQDSDGVVNITKS
jgi:hypothetical protein